MTRRAGRGDALWTTRHGQAFLVDHTGTQRLTPHQADVMIDAPDGVEIYWTEAGLDSRLD